MGLLDQVCREHLRPAGAFVPDGPVRKKSEHAHQAEFAAGSSVVVELRIGLAHFVHQ